MAARKSSRVNRKYKTKYRVINWREYERGLKSRGDITVWFSKEAIDAWTPPKNGRRGGQPCYSNLAILTALTLRVVFHLPLRQTEGFLDSLLRLMELDLKAPDHTTLSRRNKDVDVSSPTKAHDSPNQFVQQRPAAASPRVESMTEGAPEPEVSSSLIRRPRIIGKRISGFFFLTTTGQTLRQPPCYQTDQES